MAFTATSRISTVFRVERGLLMATVLVEVRRASMLAY
jgi:hypothetical protein